MSGAPHPTDVRVGRLLRERRLQLAISQERLGALLGVTYQQVQKYERGTNRIGSSRLQDLCRVLGVRSNYFFDEPATYAESETPDLAAGSALAETSRPFDRTDAPLDHGLSEETRELVCAFGQITDEAVRRHIVDLMRSLAGMRRPRGSGNT